MAKSLNQLYFAATGLTKVDVEQLVEDINAGKLSEEEKAAKINSLMWGLPGGVSNKGAEFKEAFEAALSGNAVAPAVIDEVEDEDDSENSSAEVVEDEE